MSKGFDSRDFSFVRTSAGEAAAMASDAVDAAASRTVAVPRLAVRSFNEMTGTPASLSASSPRRSLVDQALEVVQGQLQGAGFGLSDAVEAPEFLPDPLVQETSAGTRVVHLHQYYRGIPIFQMARSVQFSPFEGPTAVEGDSIPPPTGLEIAPQVDPLAAVQAAAEHCRSFLESLAVPTPPGGSVDTVAGDAPADADLDATLHSFDPWSLPPDDDEGSRGAAADAAADASSYAPTPSLPTFDLSGYEPQVVASFPMPSRPTVVGWVRQEQRLEAPGWGPLGDFVPAHLVVFYQGAAVRLAWDVLITLRDHLDQYRVIVAADDPASREILYRHQTVDSAVARGKVYPFSPRPETTPAPVEVAFPRELTVYPVARELARPLADATFPRDWVEADRCVGNGVEGTLGNSSTTLKGTVDQNQVFFRPQDPIGDDQKILNIFYFCNYMHDFYYLLGFDEAAGNFQRVNFTGEGLGGDPVRARAHSGPVFGTANMATLPDGRPPIMNMGLVASTNRHTAFDADVVFHEFTHGVSNRLVGGRMNTTALEQPQSAGMGEGWSDYFALTIQNFDKSVDTERLVTGDWVTRRKGGIRLFPYGPRKSAGAGGAQFPDGFGAISSGRYPQDEHNIGEVWCAALMHMNRRIGIQVGNYKRGHQIGWQIVTDGFKLTAANPSLLKARDGILKALDDLRTAGRLSQQEHARARRGAWEAFAEFGMGFSASCPNASLQRIHAAEDLPPDLH